MLLTQSVRRAAQVQPLAPAHIDGDRVLSWRQFVARVATVAGGLVAGGLQAGDRVALMGLNSATYLEALYAVWWAGGVVVPLNTRWSHEENVYAMRDAGAVVLIVDDHFAEAAARLAGADLPLRRRIHFGAQHPADFEDYEAMIASAAPVESREGDPNALAAIYYTGGTTGFPKGVMLSPMALWTNALATALELKLDENVRYLHAAPMFHLADGCISLAVTVTGGTHVYIPAFRADETLAAIAKHKITQALLVPTMIAMVLDAPELASTDLSSLRCITYGASPISETTLQRAMAVMPNCKFAQAYGQTELAPVATYLPPEQHLGPNARLRSAGRASFAAEVKIADENGVELPRGEAGEVWVRGPGVMLGYWRKPAETAAALVDGWVRTGDAAAMDEDGYIQIRDRIKDMIISGGENVYSAEVENALASHPDVAAVAVIGVPDATLGERVHAVVVTRHGAAPTQESLYAHARERIAGYKCPRSMELRTDPLPLSGAGKVLKTALRAPHWDGKARQVN